MEIIWILHRKSNRFDSILRAVNFLIFWFLFQKKLFAPYVLGSVRSHNLKVFMLTCSNYNCKWPVELTKATRLSAGPAVSCTISPTAWKNMVIWWASNVIFDSSRVRRRQAGFRRLDFQISEHDVKKPTRKSPSSLGMTAHGPPLGSSIESFNLYFQLGGLFRFKEMFEYKYRLQFEM